MKDNQNHDNATSDGPQTLPVHIEFTDPEAVSVRIAGTFHNGQPAANPMPPLGNSRWVKVTLLPVGTYEYCLVVDRTFRPEPLAKETVPNPFGGRNSILKVVSMSEPVRSAT